MEKKFYLNKQFFLWPVLLTIFGTAVLSYAGLHLVEAYKSNALSSLKFFELVAGFLSPILIPATLYFVLPPLFMNRESLRFDDEGLHIREGAFMKNFSWSEIVSCEQADLYAEFPSRFLIKKDCIRVEHVKKNTAGPIWLIPKKYNTSLDILLADLEAFGVPKVK